MPEKRQTIMLVDDNQANLNIAKNILKSAYEVYALPSAERLFMFLRSVTPDLILLDVEMPDMNGFDIIKILKADPRHNHIPIIFVTAKTEETNELEGLALGAVDYVTKPFSAAILLKRIENHLTMERQKNALNKLNDSLIGMVKEKTAQVSGLQNSIIRIVAELVEFRDTLTGGHITRTQKYVEMLINRLIADDVYTDEVLRWDSMEYIVPSTQLHDLGKIFISDAILNKPGKLTPEEFETMKTHSQKGADALRMLEESVEERAFLRYAETVASTHHEKWDGTGYPNGLKGEDIPLLGRLMAIADVYDALTSARPYKKAFSPEESARIIIEGAGTHFDPLLVELFVKMEGEFAEVAASANRGAARQA